MHAYIGDGVEIMTLRCACVRIIVVCAAKGDADSQIHGSIRSNIALIATAGMRSVLGCVAGGRRPAARSYPQQRESQKGSCTGAALLISPSLFDLPG